MIFSTAFNGKLISPKEAGLYVELLRVTLNLQNTENKAFSSKGFHKLSPFTSTDKRSKASDGFSPDPSGKILGPKLIQA